MTDVQSLSGIDRRTVVRAGVATAWSVPLVQAVAASPAFAVSGPAALSATPVVSGNGATRRVTFTIQNSAGSATTALNATVTAQSSNVSVVTRISSTWSGSGPFTANSQLAGNNSTTTFVVDVTKQNNSQSASLVIVFAPGNPGTAATVTVPLPK